MSYDVKTPVLADTIRFLRNASNGLAKGTMEAKEAKAIAAVENEVIKAVGMDVKARLALPKISAMEAQLIEERPAAPAIEKAAHAAAPAIEKAA
jgi:hypothetical protein